MCGMTGLSQRYRKNLDANAIESNTSREKGWLNETQLDQDESHPMLSLDKLDKSLGRLMPLRWPD